VVVFILLYMTIKKVADVSPLTIQIDWKSHQQCASSAVRRGGTARDMIGTTTSREVTDGKPFNGLTADAEMYSLDLHQAKHSAVEEESCHAATTQIIAFEKLPGESIDLVLAR